MSKKLWLIILLTLLLFPLVCVASIKLLASQPSIPPVEQKIEVVEPLIPELSDKPTKAEVAAYIAKKSLEQGVDSNLMLRLAKCESGYNYLAKNPNSTASGVFQFIRATWSSTRAQMGVDKSSPFNAKDNIDTAIWKVKHGGLRAWNASKACWG